MRPAYMTATRSHSLATMPRSWVTKTMARPVSRWISFKRRRYCAWIVTSSEVVGSSAIRRLGWHEMAMAPATRWRMPPLIWCG